MDQLVRAELDEIDEILRGDGNGKPGLVNRVRTLEKNQEKVMPMLDEWTSLKSQIKGAKFTVIAVGLIIAMLGGGLGVAILGALGRLASALP